MDRNEVIFYPSYKVLWTNTTINDRGVHVCVRMVVLFPGWKERKQSRSCLAVIKLLRDSRYSVEELVNVHLWNKLTTTQFDELNLLETRRITTQPCAVTACVVLSWKNFTADAWKSLISTVVDSERLNCSSSLYDFQFCYKSIKKGTDRRGPAVKTMFFLHAHGCISHWSG
jgi:hypothetical protein